MNDIVPIVLAAGSSVRMGYPKALLPLEGGTFLSRILDTLDALGFAEPRVVVGAHAARIAPTIEGRRARVIENPDHANGQLSSIRCGIRTIGPEAAACMLWPVDHPAVSRRLVTELVARYRESRSPIVLPVCDKRHGHPAIIDRRLFAELLELPADAGAKSVMLRHEAEMALVPTGETGVVLDIDTPADYQMLTGVALEEALERARAR